MASSSAPPPSTHQINEMQQFHGQNGSDRHRQSPRRQKKRRRDEEVDESKADRPRSVTDGANVHPPAGSDGYHLAAPNPKLKLRSRSDGDQYDNDSNQATWDQNQSAVNMRESAISEMQEEQEESQRRRSVFDDSSSDDSELEVDPNHKNGGRRLTVNLRDAKHINVNGNMGNLSVHK